jgi:hypothetical protein
MATGGTLTLSGRGVATMSRSVSRSAFLGIALIAVLACAPEPEATDEPATAESTLQEAPPNTLTEQERRDGWRLLFDGSTTRGWRGYKQPSMPAGWQVMNGALTRTGQTSDIITDQQFGDFELALEWKIAPGGNSGIFFRAIEGQGAIYEYAPEVQVLDDAGHADGLSELTSAGSNFALHPAARGVVRPAGQWNSARLRVDGGRVQHWLNGQLIVDYQISSDDWKRRVAASKFAAWPQYGLAQRGHIGLQEHGNEVAFRSIKIRELP